MLNYEPTNLRQLLVGNHVHLRHRGWSLQLFLELILCTPTVHCPPQATPHINRTMGM